MMMEHCDEANYKLDRVKRGDGHSSQYALRIEYSHTETGTKVEETEKTLRKKQM
jgi:hypothetical protein